MLWGYGELKSIAARRAASTGLCIIDSVIVAYALFGHRRLFHCPWMTGLYLLTAFSFFFSLFDSVPSRVLGRQIATLGKIYKGVPRVVPLLSWAT